MITLNDYLYSGDTIFRILRNYTVDLKKEAKKNHNEIDLIHSNFLIQFRELLEHNDFLTAQSQKIRDFYKYMVQEYPLLAFTFKGRIKSLIRAEEKFNGYIVEYIYDYYEKHHTYPPVPDLREKLSCFRDIIAYRLVISLPKCHIRDDKLREEEEIKYLYRIANVLPVFLEERGFTAEPAKGVLESTSPFMDEAVKPYYRDYISNGNPNVGSRNPFDAGKVRQKNEGNMPLMIAAWEGKKDFVIALCEDERTSINQQDANGFTALMKACMNGHFENNKEKHTWDIRKILIDAGADQKIVDIDGKTAADWVSEYHESGPTRKQFNRGNNTNSQKRGNRRW